MVDGGLKMLSVQDDGTGIRLEDLPILCERHTTSKLVAFEDLQSIGACACAALRNSACPGAASFGFRGEALASISHVAHVTVTTMTANAPCAYRACYAAGVLENGAPPKPCAGNRGTIVQADDLFFNLRQAAAPGQAPSLTLLPDRQRREALRNPAEEMKKIIHVVQRYAVHFSGRVSFVLRKQGNASPEVITMVGSDLNTNLGSLFGGERSCLLRSSRR